MKQSIRLVANKPNQNIEVPWSATTCQIVNPTGSAVLCRFGGSDIPSRANSDMVVGPQSIVQAPVMGGSFCFAFDDPTKIGTRSYPFSSAIISVLDANERLSAIGSIQGGIARLAPYDRNPASTGAEFFQTVPGTPPTGLTTAWSLTVPNGVQYYIESWHIEATRIAVATTLNQFQAYIRLVPAIGGSFTLASLFMLTNTSGDRDRAVGGGVWMQPGDTLTGYYIDSSTGGQHWLHMTAKVQRSDQ